MNSLMWKPILPGLIWLLVVLANSFAQDMHGADEGQARPHTQHDFHAHSKDDLKHQQQHLREVVGLDAEGRKRLTEEFFAKQDQFQKDESQQPSRHQVMMHFFVQHDYDKSHSLDGIELSGALSSYYDFGMPSAPQRGMDTEQISLQEKTVPLLLHEEVEAIVDRILHDHDTDRDGLLTFTELLANSDGIWGALDLVDDLDDADYEDDDDPSPTAAENLQHVS